MNLISFLPSNTGGISDSYTILLTKDMWTIPNESILAEEVYDNIPDACDGLTYNKPPTYNAFYQGFVFDEQDLDQNGMYYVSEKASSYACYYDRTPRDDVGFVYKKSLVDNPIFLYEAKYSTGLVDGFGNQLIDNICVDRMSIPIVLLSKEQTVEFLKYGVTSIDACVDEDGRVWIISRGGVPSVSDSDENDGASLQLFIVS